MKMSMFNLLSLSWWETNDRNLSLFDPVWEVGYKVVKMTSAHVTKVLHDHEQKETETKKKVTVKKWNEFVASVLKFICQTKVWKSFSVLRNKSSALMPLLWLQISLREILEINLLLISSILPFEMVTATSTAFPLCCPLSPFRNASTRLIDTTSYFPLDFKYWILNQ